MSQTQLSLDWSYGVLKHLFELIDTMMIPSHFSLKALRAQTASLSFL